MIFFQFTDCIAFVVALGRERVCVFEIVCDVKKSKKEKKKVEAACNKWFTENRVRVRFYVFDCHLVDKM